ncbi:hypothetical protein HK099_002617 [Clydaea vesicula]|uniref:SH3 domain-containing protein n=1 Tax=Clydaea vesicula TaxID=447962 RepID=A0AAD5Y1A0_9FUNG|nr:hypothetical protein HK099_002617 [Clydaea vesicula]
MIVLFLIAVSSSVNFTDVKSFDEYLLNSMPNSNIYQKTFQTFYGCPNYLGLYERFHISTMCYFLVQQSGCPQPSNIVPLCKESCDSFLNSQKEIFTNATTCNQTVTETLKSQRNENPYKNFCATLPSLSNTSCSLGQEPESLQCGFMDKAEATSMCSTVMKQDKCCTDFMESQLRALDAVLNAPNNIGLIVGIATTAVLVLIILFFLYIRGKRWSKQATSAVPMSIADKKVSVIGHIARGAGFKNSFIQPLPPKKANLDSLYSQAPTAVSVNTGNQSKFKVIRKNNDEVPTLPPLSDMLKSKTTNANKSRQDLESGNKLFENNTLSTSMEFPKASKENPIRMVVIDTYNAALDDELQLTIDDIVIAEETFDDGWALGKNLTTNRIGAFPLACCLPVESDRSSRRDTRVGGRNSSLYNSVMPAV